jgi:hypothetical protein
VEYFFHPFFYLIQEYGNLDSDLKHILITFVMAGLGGSLFAFRNKVKGELFDQFEAMELLLLIVIPSVEGYSFIMINPTNYSWAISLYVVAVMVWFVIVITKHKPISDSKKEKIFTIKISYISAVLLAYGIFAFWLLNTYNQMLTHTP